MKIIFLGATQFSKSMLSVLIENRFDIRAIFTIPEFFSISYSESKVRNYNYADLNDIAYKYSIPIYEVDSEPGKKITDYGQVINEINPDLIVVMGWYYILPRVIRESAKWGAWGIHASLLPDYAGGAPLTWAIINGEKETGVTLFKFDDNVDGGDVIRQQSFAIKHDDTIKEVYARAENVSRDILIDTLKHIDSVTFTPQDKSKLKIYPQRKPEDGEIDLSKPAEELYNFIRAQSAPYPGAFIRTVDNKKLIIERARIEE